MSFAVLCSIDTFSLWNSRPLTVKIGRNVSGAGSIIGAGFSTTNAIPKDNDDTIIGGVASVIASLTITGTAAPETYFAGGRFKAAPRIAGQVVAPATDARFKIG